MNQKVSVLIRESLSNIRKSVNIIQFSLRIDPYSLQRHKLLLLQQQLQKYQQKAAKLVIDRKLAPSLATCAPIAAFALLTCQITNQKFGQQSLVIRLKKYEEWANDCIRQLNQLGLQQKQLRQITIGFRNNIQQYTMDKEVNSICGKLFNYII